MHVYVHTNETVDTPFTSSNSGLKTGTELNRTVGQNRAGISYPLSLFAILLLLLPPKKMNPPPVQIQFMEPETSGPTPGRFPAYDSAFCAPVGAAVPLVRRRRRRADKLLKHPTVTGTRKKRLRWEANGHLEERLPIAQGPVWGWRRQARPQNAGQSGGWNTNVNRGCSDSIHGFSISSEIYTLGCLVSLPQSFL